MARAPGMGLASRDVAAWAATAVITASIRRTQYHCAAWKTTARIKPTR
jgi:hypothetical protein